MIQNSFFDFRDQLLGFKIEAEQKRIQFEKELVHLFPIRMIECVCHLYDAKRFEVECVLGLYSDIEKGQKQKRGMDRLKYCAGLPIDYEISYKKLIDLIEKECNPVLLYLNQYKQCLVELYRASISLIWHVSSVPDIQVLNPSNQKENIFCNEICNAVYTTSSFYDILLYIGRCSGYRMDVIDNMCFYQNIPYKEWNSDKIILKNKAVVYSLDIQDFEPVIDVVRSNTKICLKFEHEWIHRGSIKVRQSEYVLGIPTSDVKQYHMFYGRKSMDLFSICSKIRQEKVVKERKRYVQQLIDDGIIGYIDLQNV